MKKEGFTLIELLVVIAIVSLLSSVVLAQVNSARDKARITAGNQFGASIFHSQGPNLVGKWDFDDGSGTIIKDSSGNGKDGSISGSNYSWTTGANNGGLQLWGGTTANINFGSGLWKSSDLTISFWVKPVTINCCYVAAMGINANLLFAAGGYGGVGTGDGFRMGIRGISSDTVKNTVEWATGQNGGTASVRSTQALATGQWFHVALTYDSSSMVTKIYINAQDAGSSTGGTYVAPGIISGNNSIQLNGTGSAFYGNNIYDDLRIYDSSLLASDIQKIYAESPHAVELAKR